MKNKTGVKKDFDVAIMAAELFARFPSKFEAQTTRTVWYNDYLRILGHLSGDDLKAAYHKTIDNLTADEKKFTVIPSAGDILKNVPEKLKGHGMRFHNAMLAHVAEKKGSIIDEINMICQAEIKQAKENGWKNIDLLINLTAQSQASIDFLRKQGRTHISVNMTTSKDRARLGVLSKITMVGYVEFSHKPYDWLQRYSTTRPLALE